MDFETCYNLLASRPAHAHEHCVGEKHDHDDKDVQAVADAVAADLNIDGEAAQSPVEHDNAELTVAQLGCEFFALQECRVQIYNDFQDGFNKFKATPQFQSFCASITVRFADVSKRVNAIEATLRQRQHVVLAQLIRKVQAQEKEKLMLTSALFVEKMRLAEPDETTAALLERSITSMSSMHTEILVQINELLDELRMELADEE